MGLSAKVGPFFLVECARCGITWRNCVSTRFVEFQIGWQNGKYGKRSKPYGATDEVAVPKFEKLIQHKLPKPFWEYMLQYNGG